MQPQARRAAAPLPAAGDSVGRIHLVGLGPDRAEELRRLIPALVTADSSLWTDAPNHPDLAGLTPVPRLLPASPQAAAALLGEAALRSGTVLAFLLGDPEQDSPALVAALREQAAQAGGPGPRLTPAPAWWPRALALLDPPAPPLTGSWQWASAADLLVERHPWLDPGRPALLRLDGLGEVAGDPADETAGRAAADSRGAGQGSGLDDRLLHTSLWPQLRARLAPAYGRAYALACLGWRGEGFAVQLGLDDASAGLPVGTRLLYLPPLDADYSWPRLLAIVAHLRAPDGCPWDREQTHQSLRPYLLEEAYEAVEALDAGDWPAFCDELGDLLLQVVLHAQVAVEEDRFAIRDVLAALSSKLVRRHPHVFGDVAADTAEEVLVNWEALKRVERAAKGKAEAAASAAEADASPDAEGEAESERRAAWAALEGIPKAMPALARAQLLLRKARRQPALAAQLPPTVPADLPLLLDRALASGAEADLGELLWRLAGWALDAGLDAEEALRGRVATLPPPRGGPDRPAPEVARGS